MNRFRTPLVLGAIAALAAFPSGCAGTSATPTPSVVVAPGAIVIEAASLAFAPRTIHVDAGISVQLVLRNRDTSVPHNVELRDAGQVVFKGETITGPADVAYQIGPLAAGSYEFLCTVHPAMTGRIDVD